MTQQIGAVRVASGSISLEGRPRMRLTVENTSRRIVRVSSHFPFGGPTTVFDLIGTPRMAITPRYTRRQHRALGARRDA